MNGRFRLLQSHPLNRDYLIPNASWADIPGVVGGVPRGFCQDASLIAEIMALAPLVNHGLSPVELDEVYKHHCVELGVNTGRSWKLTPEESITVLHHYIQRVTAKYVYSGDS